MSAQRKRKPKIRYDRIAVVAVIFIILIVLLASCINSCSKKKDDSESTSSKASSSQAAVKDDKSSKKDSKDDSDTKKKDESSKEKKTESEAGETEYTTLNAIPNDVFSGDLIVVNKDNEYQFPADESDNGELVSIYSTKTESYQVKDMETMLRKEVVDQLNSMMDAFYGEKKNTDLMVISAYRTKEYQDGLYNSGSSDVKGGFAEYHTGLSFDLGIFPAGQNSYYYTNSGDYAWIADNCASYGFIIRYPKGKEDKTGYDASTHQFRYVGIPHAYYITENNLCLEEYIDMLKDYKYGEQTLSVTADDAKYEIYYVASDASGDTEIPVPSNKDYTVSGNNKDGFIVTVKL